MPDEDEQLSTQKFSWQPGTLDIFNTPEFKAQWAALHKAHFDATAANARIYARQKRRDLLCAVSVLVLIIIGVGYLVP